MAAQVAALPAAAELNQTEEQIQSNVQELKVQEAGKADVGNGKLVVN